MNASDSEEEEYVSMRRSTSNITLINLANDTDSESDDSLGLEVKY